jgi:inorganic triphosphatase YgiF
MEIELKYRIPSKEVASEIWKDKMFCDYEERGTREEMCLDASYYDTSNCDLAKNHIAYRVRKEGERWIAALKMKGNSEDGLHVREEICVPVVDGNPDPTVFRESEAGEELLRVIGRQDIDCFLKTEVHRKRFRIDTGTGIFEISIDTGRILTEYGEAPICEVEVELFSGETEELLEIGQKIQRKYSLETEDMSKYARGIALIKEGRNR